MQFDHTENYMDRMHKIQAMINILLPFFTKALDKLSLKSHNIFNGIFTIVIKTLTIVILRQ